MMRSRASILDVVQAAYRVEPDVSSWLEGLLASAEPLLDRGFGVMAWSLRVNAAGKHEFTSPIAATAQVPTGMPEECERLNPMMEPEVVARTHASPRTLATISDALAPILEGPIETWPLLAGPRALGTVDCLAAKAYDPSGIGFAFAAPLRRVERPPIAEEPRWARVMAHVLAGLRLRSGLLSEEGDAVLEPDGRVLHATEDARSASAREALRNAAITIDRARAASGRADPDAALGRWKALVAGRWSLVDRFESDGRRFLIARKNDPAVDGSPMLTERSRQILAYAAMGYTNQNIAYALGLAPSTVSTHLQRAMRRLGVKGRADLAALLAPAPSSGPPK